MSGDGTATTLERARTTLVRLLPAATVRTAVDDNQDRLRLVEQLQHLADLGLIFTLLIAGCSLAVSVAGGLVERRRPFTLLRLAGMRLPELRRVILIEAAAPLVLGTALSATVGLAVAALILDVAGPGGFQPPNLTYFALLTGGVAAALAIVLTTLPLLNRSTRAETVRFE